MTVVALSHPLTFVVVHEDVLVARVVFVVVAVADGDGESVGAADGRVAAVLHDDGHVIFFLLLTVKCLQTCHHPGAVAIAASTCSETNQSQVWKLFKYI